MPPAKDRRLVLTDIIEAQVDAFLARINTQRGTYATGQWKLYLGAAWVSVDLPEVTIPMDERTRDYVRGSILSAALAQIVS